MILEHLDVLLLALGRQKRHSRFHRYDVHMQVKHTCPLTASLNCWMMVPSASKAFMAATAIVLLLARLQPDDPLKMSKDSAAGAFGITSVWPGVRGMMSRNANVCAFS